MRRERGDIVDFCHKDGLFVKFNFEKKDIIHSVGSIILKEEEQMKGEEEIKKKKMKRNGTAIITKNELFGLIDRSIDYMVAVV